MENIFVEFLPPWIETGLQPAFYDKESGTVLQQTARMYARVNMLIRMFNRLSKNTKTVVEDYIEQFNELHDYVHDYFDNLDVQEEINNKLDAMAQDGSLQECIMIDNIIDVTRPGRNLTPMAFDGTNETTKLQAIIDWAIDNGGAKLILPVGTTQVSQLSITGHGPLNIEIIGQGEATKLESITSNNSNMIDIQTDEEDSQIDRVVLDDFAIIGNESQSGVKGIYCNNVCNECVIKNLLVKGFDTGIELYKCWTMKVLNCNIYKNTAIGLDVRSETHNSTIFGNKISYNDGIGLQVRSCYQVNVENNDIEGNDYDGIVLNNTHDVNIFKNYIENNGTSDADTYYEIKITDSLSPNIMFNNINANTVNNVISINPTSTYVEIRNNTFTGGGVGKKLLLITATSNTAVSGAFVDNTHGSFDAGMTPFTLASSSFRVDYYTQNQEAHISNGTTYKKLMSNTGDYVIRTGKNGAVRFELNYNGDNPLINIATGTAGSETYKKIIELMSDLNVEVRKSLSFSTQQSGADIAHNNALYVATNGALRFKDGNGVIKEITMTTV